MGAHTRKSVRVFLPLVAVALLLGGCTDLLLPAPAGPTAAKMLVTVSWDANSEPDVAGYKVYYGLGKGAYSESVDVGNNTSCVLDLEPGKTYHISATAYNTHGQESGFAQEVVFSGS